MVTFINITICMVPGKRSIHPSTIVYFPQLASAKLWPSSFRKLSCSWAIYSVTFPRQYPRRREDAKGKRVFYRSPDSWVILSPVQICFPFFIITTKMAWKRESIPSMISASNRIRIEIHFSTFLSTVILRMFLYPLLASSSKKVI